MTAKTWYQNGLRFECTQCGNCCTGAPGYVWVNQAEMEQLAEVIGINDLDDFKQRFTQKVGIRYSLKELPNYDCVFFDSKTRRCRVYEARPRQCRTWPFWDSNLKSPETWNNTCEVCPGSGKGQLVEVEEIEKRRMTFKL